jgi:hypothetical protein
VHPAQHVAKGATLAQHPHQSVGDIIRCKAFQRADELADLLVERDAILALRARLRVRLTMISTFPDG